MKAHTYYDLASGLYDRFAANDRVRRWVVKRLSLPQGSAVLDLACGTGLNFPFLVEALGPEGRIIGLDYSRGMLRRAADKVERNRWANITLIHEDARNISSRLLQERAGVSQVDGLICALALSVVPDWEGVFDKAFSLVRSGGRCVIWDRRTVSGPLRVWNPLWFVWNKLTAAADARRPTWKLLDGRVEDLWVTYWLGGFVFIASGKKR